MAGIDFFAPSYRASGSDLTVAVSPLGMVELADEEFEVHGPRLQRYASAFAWYLGHHWTYRRPQGESQLVFNYVRAFADYHTNFTFGRGVEFRCPEQNQTVIPYLLKDVWEIHNQKNRILWEMGQNGSVTGDCFIKVAYEEPYVDSIGRMHQGRIRILPLNPSSVFPEFHPHDRTRFLRVKIKYRFWGCVDSETEALTKRGWLRYSEITEDDEILTLDPETDEMRWSPVEAVNVYPYEGHLIKWDNHIDALTTPNHRWLSDSVTYPDGTKASKTVGDRSIVRTSIGVEGDAAVPDLPATSRIIVGGGTPLCFSDFPKYDDELVETVGWYVTEGWDHVNQTGCRSIYIGQKREEGLARIRRLQDYWRRQGATFTEYPAKKDGVISFYLGKGVKQAVWDVADGKTLTPEFISSLTFAQAELLYNTLMLADGNVRRDSHRWTQIDPGRVDGFQMLCAMLGKRSAQTSCGEKVQVYKRRTITAKHTAERAQRQWTDDGIVWCPTVSTGIWFARRNGSTYWTGNTSISGTRTVYTYTEILTDDMIEEYINDELIDSRPNPLGKIPVVHIPNIPISGSPWGQSDIYDIIPLNREFNEKMTEISDILNYHCVDDETEVLTSSGWKHRWEVEDGDTILTLNPETNHIEWQEAVFNEFDFDGNLIKWDNHIDALTTPGHRWLAERRIGRDRRFEREFVRTSEAAAGERSVQQLTQGSRIVLGGGAATEFTEVPKFDDHLVELVAWWVTEGCVQSLPSGNRISYLHQSAKANPEYVDDIRRLAAYWQACGFTMTEQRERPNGVVGWYLGTALTEMLTRVAPGKGITPEFVTSLTHSQAVRFHEILLQADGTGTAWYQDDPGRVDGFQMLCAMLGKRTNHYVNNRGNGVVLQYKKPTILAEHTPGAEQRYTGKVWCPTVANGTWMARRNGVTYWTGNSAPVTIMTGARASDLVKNANRMWSGLPKDAKVYNLEMATTGFTLPMDYVQALKRAMHEMVNIPESALGQMQPISNTSGVALSIQYQPLMNRYGLKKIQYTEGLKQINELVILTAAIFRPDLLMYAPGEGASPDLDQPIELDPTDPVTYMTTVHWPDPLPVDKLIKLNEEQAKMMLGLQSKRGALRELGEEFPNDKVEEIFEERRRDIEEQGALDYLQAQVSQAIMLLTGMVPGQDGAPSAGGGDAGPSQGAGGEPNPNTGISLSIMEDIMNRLNQQAYGANVPLRTTPDADD